LALECWKPIPGWEDLYKASSDGRIKSEDRVSTYIQGNALVTRRRKGKVLTPIKMNSGYWGVILCRDGARSYIPIHRLVAAAFYGPRPKELVTRHIDGNVDNNTVENLAYGTTQENVDDRSRHGRTSRGDRHPLAKLSDVQIREMRRIHAETNASTRALASRFGVSNVRVSQILRGGHRP